MPLRAISDQHLVTRLEVRERLAFEDFGAALGRSRQRRDSVRSNRVTNALIRSFSWGTEAKSARCSASRPMISNQTSAKFSHAEELEQILVRFDDPACDWCEVHPEPAVLGQRGLDPLVNGVIVHHQGPGYPATPAPSS